MTGKTHIIGGFTAGMATLYIAEMQGVQLEGPTRLISYGVFLLSSCMAATAPDVDEKNSMVSRRLTILPLIFCIIQFFCKALVFFSIGKEAKQRMRRKVRIMMHRGIAHYAITWIFLTGTAMVIGNLLYFILLQGTGKITIMAIIAGISVGYLSHLLLDMLSGKIAILSPFICKPIGCNLFPCRSFREYYIARPLLIAIGGYFIYKIYLEAVWNQTFNL